MWVLVVCFYCCVVVVFCLVLVVWVGLVCCVVWFVFGDGFWCLFVLC